MSVSIELTSSFFRSGSLSGKKAPLVAPSEREKRDDKDSSSSSSEKGDSKSVESSKSEGKEKDTKESAGNGGTTSGVTKKKEEDSSEEPRKRRGKPPKKFAESSFEVHIPTRKESIPQTKEGKDKDASKDGNQIAGNKKEDDVKEKESLSKKPDTTAKEGSKEEKTRTAKDDKVSRESKETTVIVAAPAATKVKEERKDVSASESPAPAPVKKLVEVSPEHAARVFAVKSKPPESSPPPVSASSQVIQTGPSAQQTAITAVPEKGVEREVAQAPAVVKDNDVSKDSSTEQNKERLTEDEPAAKEKPTTPKRARLAKRKKPATPSTENKTEKAQKSAERTEDKSDGNAPADKSCVVSQAPATKAQSDESHQVSPAIVKAEQSEGEDTDIEKDPVVPTLLPIRATSATAVGTTSKETQSIEDDDDRDEETLKVGGTGAEEEASTEVEEGHLEDSLADNVSII